MIEIIPVAPENEMPIARRLRDLIRSAWPDIEASAPSDGVRILVGLRASREIDVLVELNLARPRAVPSVQRRDGSHSAAAEVQSALIIFEIKQLDRARFVVQGTQIFADYDPNRSVNKQTADAVTGVCSLRDRYDVTPFFVHGLAWLTDVPDDALQGVESNILGESATWFDILDAAVQQNGSICGSKSEGYQRSVRLIADKLSAKRKVSSRDRRRVDTLTTSTLSEEMLAGAKAVLGKRQIRFVGRGGSGKSTALALLARDVSAVEGERVLILTYHRALRNELEHLVRTLSGDEPFATGRIAVRPIADFLANAFEELGGRVPFRDGQVDYSVLDDAFHAALGDSDFRERMARDILALKELDPETFAFDYIFVDEAQDCHDGERDLLRLMYAPEQFVLADGVDQFVRRQVPCDWTVGLPRARRHAVEMKNSLRMSANVAAFANEVALAAGLRNWEIKPHPELGGGRVILYRGDPCNDRDLFDELATSVKDAKGDLIDMLVCVPPKMVSAGAGGVRSARIGEALTRWDFAVWNGCDAKERDRPPASGHCVRVVQYDSMRGLEGWATLLLELDEFYEHRLKYPHLVLGESSTPDDVAKRWLMMALTRAAHIVVVGLTDKDSQAARLMEEAAARLPHGVVERRG